MLKLYTRVQALWLTRDRGASAVEYGLMVAAIAAVIAALVYFLGGRILAAFQTTCTELNDNTVCPTT